MSLCKKVTPGAEPFLTPGYNLNNPGSGPQDKVTFNISLAWTLISDKIFSFAFSSLSKKKWPFR